MSHPLLELDDVRIDFDGRCVLDNVSLCSSGDRIGLLGQGQFIFEALAGAADVIAGEVRLGGIELSQAQAATVFATARPWPTRSNTTLRDGLIVSALLGGCTNHSAKQRADRAIEQLGLGTLSRQKFHRRPRVDYYLAGLAEAALFEPEIVVLDWPIGLLEVDGWSRYGLVLSRLIQHRRWLAWVPGSARHAVEQSWIGALDQLIWVEDALCVDLSAAPAGRVRTIVVIDAAIDVLPEGLDTEELRLSPMRLASPFGERRTAFVVELPRDEFGRPITEALLGWCDRHRLPIFRLDPLDRGI